MKLTCIVLLSMISFSAFAQISQDELKKKLQQYKIKQQVEPHFYWFGPGDHNPSVKHLVKKLPSAGVYNLPQDNMPCIVPNLMALAKIPNASPITIPFRAQIPNAAPLVMPLPEQKKYSN